MKYRIRRTSVWDETIQPCDGAVMEMVPYWDARGFKTPQEHDARPGYGQAWMSRGTEHGTWSGGIVRRLDDQPAWLVEAESIEALFERFGQLVIGKAVGSHPDRPEMEVEIYDTHRE